MIHDFTTMDGVINKAKETMDEITTNLRETFHKSKIQKKVNLFISS